VCLQYLTSLERLALESNLIGNLGLEAMTRALVHNVSLTEIFLYNNDLDDDTMREFSAMLGNKSRLVTLGLEYNRIRSRGANHVFEALNALPNFERLFLSHNLISEDSGMPI
jgi:Leucine-rich repeat (LRR) protein